MLKNFIKYQSLKNDFIIFDWYKKPAVYVHSELAAPAWLPFVKQACDRHLGVGADGVLVITSDAHLGMPEILVFNADGSRAESCFNGLRCVADYLYISYHFPLEFHIKMGSRVIDCSVLETPDKHRLITTQVGAITYEGEKTINISQGDFSGFVVNVGNPHFIVKQQISLDWLATHGKLLESHEQFPARTNVEFIWSAPTLCSHVPPHKAYAVLVYERGCGITQACSSGATAIVGLLYKQGIIKAQEKIDLCMPGGSIICWIDEKENVYLSSLAYPVFSGSFDNAIVPTCTTDETDYFSSSSV